MTGQEIKWKAAKNLASDHDGFKVAMSGGVQAMFVSILILVAAFTFSQPLYFITQAFIGVASKAFGQRHFDTGGISATECTQVTQLLDFDGDDNQFLLGNEQTTQAAPLLVKNEKAQEKNLWRLRLVLLTPSAIICILLFVRPAHFPYAHMSQSLPYTLAEIWYSFDGDLCEAGHFEDVPPFPFQDLVAPELWEPEKGAYVGWRPAGNISASYLAEQRAKRPSWLPTLPMQGLERWWVTLQ